MINTLSNIEIIKSTLKNADLSLWEAFVWVGRKQTLTAAGMQLGLGTAQISKKISKLESLLSVRLFTRTTRKVRLTPEGQTLFASVESLLDQARTVEGQVDENRPIEGVIRVACLPAFANRCLAPSLARFLSKHPRVEIELDVSDAIVDLVEARIDVAIRVQEPTGAQNVFRKILENKMLLCASPGYLKRAGNIPKNLKELEKHPLLASDVFDDLTFIKEKITIGKLRCPRPIRCPSGSVITELAVHGAGIALRSAWDVSPLINAGKLVKVLTHCPLENFGNLYAVTPHRQLLPTRVRAFLDFLAAEAKQVWGA